MGNQLLQPAPVQLTPMDEKRMAAIMGRYPAVYDALVRPSDSTLQSLAREVDKNPDRFDAHFKFRVACLNARKTQVCLNCYKQIELKHKDNWQIKAQKAKVEEELDLTMDAVENFTSALYFEPQKIIKFCREEVQSVIQENVVTNVILECLNIPSNPQAELPTTKFMRERIKQFIAELEETYLQSNQAHPLVVLGMTALQKGFAGVATDCFARAVKVDATNPAAFNWLGMALAAIDRENESERAFALAIQVENSNAPRRQYSCFNFGLIKADLTKVPTSEVVVTALTNFKDRVFGWFKSKPAEEKPDTEKSKKPEEKSSSLRELETEKPAAKQVASSEKSVEVGNAIPESKSKTDLPPDDHLCKICFDKPADCVLIPCRHLSFCAACVRDLKKQQCPLCNTNIQTTLKIFRS